MKLAQVTESRSVRYLDYNECVTVRIGTTAYMYCDCTPEDVAQSDEWWVATAILDS